MVQYDLSLSDRVVGTGLYSVLCDVLLYCFRPADTLISDVAIINIACGLCRDDCSFYAKPKFNNGVM